jgi:hypothetical protein
MRNAVSCLVMLALAACDAEVTIEDGSGGASNSSSGSPKTTAGQTGGGTKSTGSTGTPCAYLHGTTTIQSWTGEASTYQASTFSFEFATNDIAITNNDVDVLYDGNDFVVNTVVDDQSFVVQLGDVPLASVPSYVDPTAFPTGEFDEHDYVQSVLDRTYMVRTIDGDTTQWVAFRVVGLSPGANVTIEWEKSTSPDQMIVPSQCGV